MALAERQANAREAAGERPRLPDLLPAVIELYLTGVLPFERSALDLRAVEDESHAAPAGAAGRAGQEPDPARRFCRNCRRVAQPVGVGAASAGRTFWVAMCAMPLTAANGPRWQSTSSSLR